MRAVYTEEQREQRRKERVAKRIEKRNRESVIAAQPLPREWKRYGG